MPQTPHIERHFTSSEVVRDIVIRHGRSTAFIASVFVTLIALAVFGYIKGRFTGAVPIRSASQTLVTGALAATAAYVLARLIS